MRFQLQYVPLLAALFGNIIKCMAETVVADQCSSSNRETTCQFDSKKLKLNTTKIIEILLQDGQRVKCSKETVNKDNSGWYGSCDGNATEANFVWRKDHNGIDQAFGSIQIGSKICQILPNNEGKGEIRCTAIADFPAELDPIEAPPMDEFTDQALQNLHFGFNPNIVAEHETDTVQALPGNLHRNMYDDSGATIDVMVVWTKQAECRLLLLPFPCTLTATTESYMRGFIDLAVFQSNVALQLSGMLSSLRLVHAYRDPVYVESTVSPHETTLEDITSTSDGKLDDVHTKRALYGADMVQILISTFF